MEKVVSLSLSQRYCRIKHKFNSVLLIFLLLVASTMGVWGQDGPLNIPSPEAAVFMKSGNIPVSTFTGAANINVPLFTITDGPISIPISLDYNSSGIRADEQASWAGLGFNLSYGGQITRSVRGSDDFTLQTAFNKYSSIDTKDRKILFDGNVGFNGDQFQRYAILPVIGGTNVHQYLNTTGGTIDLLDVNFDPYSYDWIPDIFYYTAGNASGKFLLDDQLQPMELKKSNTKIAYSAGTFKVTDENGVIYTYTSVDRNASMQIIASDVINTWYLNEIRSADGTHVVTIQYARSTLQTLPATTYKATSYNNGSLITSSLTNYNLIDYFYPTEIDFTGGKIVFQSSGTRPDVTGGRRLDAAILYDPAGQQVKKYTFRYSYFHYNDGMGTSNPLVFDRLKLDSVLINDDIHQAYRMDYNMNNVAPKNGGKDHWGYCNNAGSGIPKGIYQHQIIFPDGTGFIGYEPYMGGDYEAHWPYTQSMMLTKLTYPTNGYTKFTYEPNEFGNIPDYWQYDVDNYHNDSTVMYYPVQNIDTGKVVFGGLPTSVYKLTCHFYLDDPSSLTAFYIDFSLPDGTLLRRVTLSQFTYLNHNFDLLIPNLNVPGGFGGTIICKAYSNRPNFGVNPAGYFQFFFINLNMSGPSSLTHLTRKNLTRLNGGGLRIKSIVNYDGFNETAYKQYKYDRPDGTTSGTLMNYPVYTSFPAMSENNLQVYAYFNSNSIIALSTAAGGSYIGYDHVTEISGDSTHNNGSTEYDYSCLPDRQPFQYGIDLPCVTWWNNGALYRKTVYDTSHIKVSETNYSYSPFSDTWKGTTGVRFIHPPPPPPIGNPVGLFHPPIYTYRDYQLDYKLISETETVYDSRQHQTAFQTTTTYQYGDNIHPKKITRTSSTSTLDQTEFRWPNDFNTTAPVFIQEMKTYNLLSAPVETIQSRVSGSTNMAVSGKLFEFGTGTNRGLPVKQYSLDLSSPLSWTDANFSNALSGATFTFNPNYSLKQNFSYQQTVITDYSNLDARAGYRWGYNHQYVTAKCMNATSSEIYVEDFEENTATGVTTGAAHTGQRYFSGAFTVSWTRPDARNYVISYWYRSGGVWRLSGPSPYTGPSQVLSGGDAYDGIRIYPSDALITTYTYQPLVGMTSQCEPNNHVSYYEYDGQGRMKLIRDQSGNIIKTFDYHYQGQ